MARLWKLSMLQRNKIYRYNQDGKITEHYNIVNNLVVDAIRYTYAEGETSMFDTIEKCDKEVLNKSELSSFVFKCGEKKKIDYNYLKQIIIYCLQKHLKIIQQKV